MNSVGSSTGAGACLRAPSHLHGALVAITLDLPFQLVQEPVDCRLVGRCRLADDEVRPLGVHNCLDRVVIGDGGVVLERERDLDQRQIVKAPIEL